MKDYKPSFKRDIIRGNRAEAKFVKLFKDKFNIQVKKSEPYCFYDFIHENKVFELKRRNIEKNRYYTTLVGYDKIQRFEKFNAENGGKYKFIVVFHFNDGLFYFVHDSEYKYNVRPYKRKQRIDFDDKEKDYIFYPVCKLKPIENLKNMFDKKRLIVRYSI